MRSDFSLNSSRCFGPQRSRRDTCTHTISRSVESQQYARKGNVPPTDGKKRRALVHVTLVGVGKRGAYEMVHGDLPRQHPFGTTLRFTGPVPANS